MKSRLTILVDNSSATGLVCEHGLSLWIEAEDRRILFDTGQGTALERNGRSLGIELNQTDFLIASHGHYDHTGGIKLIFDIAPEVKVYLHPMALGPKYSQKDRQVKPIGMPDSAKDAIQDFGGKRRVFWTEIPTEIIPGLFVTGPIPRITDFEDTGGKFYVDPCCQTADQLVDDQAIFFETIRGLVVLLGCAHAGVVNTVDFITKFMQKNHLFAIIGGMHLLNASLLRIDNTIDVLNQYGVQVVAPLHCTGKTASERMQNAFGDRYVPMKTGETISL